MFGHDLEQYVDKSVNVIREVFDELICDRVWSGCLSRWGAIDCPFVVAFCDVFVKVLVWLQRCAKGWGFYVEVARVFWLCPLGIW